MHYVKTEGAPEAIGPYSQAVEYSGLVYVSGQIPMTAEGKLQAVTIEEQTHQVIHNLRAILQEAGTWLHNTVKVTVYLSNMDDFDKMNEVYAEHFGNHKPARTTVEVSRLPKDVKIEIEVIAKR
ncbi:deaminase [Planococcaceae bacterium Storch 2/2-2]|nr:deaminase [Planococcaceae bacterium Storch 2/2-2]